ncbi:uncharacterized protein LOC144174798 [Haemaphysalis longicornis]
MDEPSTSGTLRQRGPYGPRISPQQWELMLNFMTEKPLLGREASELRPELRTQLWNSLARLLNREGPGRRSVDNWRRLWRHRVAAARAEAAKAVADFRVTGAGPSRMLNGLDDDTVRVVNIAGLESVVGGGGPSFPARRGPGAFPVAQAEIMEP